MSDSADGAEPPLWFDERTVVTETDSSDGILMSLCADKWREALLSFTEGDCFVGLAVTPFLWEGLLLAFLVILVVVGAVEVERSESWIESQSNEECTWTKDITILLSPSMEQSSCLTLSRTLSLELEASRVWSHVNWQLHCNGLPRHNNQ